MELLVFALLALTSVGASIALVTQRNPIYCALFMVVVFVTTAAMFVALSAPFLAALQVIVYAGAIVVLFLFVISYLSQREASLVERGKLPLGVAALLGVLLVIELGLAVVASGGAPSPAAVLPVGFGSVESVARSLFTRYVIPFEITSVLLIVAMVGAVVLAQRVRGDDEVAEASGTAELGAGENGAQRQSTSSDAARADDARLEVGR